MISIWAYIQNNTVESAAIAVLVIILLVIIGKIIKHYWNLHIIAVTRIETLEGAITDKDHHVYTRAETHEKLKHIEDRIEYLSNLLEERCESNCPLSRSMQSLHDDNKDLESTIKEIAFDLHKTSYELLSLTRTLIDRFIIK